MQLILLQHTNTAKSLTYKNPLPVAFGDQYVLQGSVTYYMYGTGGGAKNRFASYSSTDLVNWKFEGQVYYGNNENGWGTGDYWAPEVFKEMANIICFTAHNGKRIYSTQREYCVKKSLHAYSVYTK